MSEFEFNIENPAELIEMLKNPDNPTVKKITQKIHAKIKEKIERGEFTQQTIISEVEAIKAKVVSLFGNIFNDALGGRRADVPATTFTSNSPEARRQRMLARMQRKVREKNSK
jgi:soluble P-type ATPase